jgi:hypothetical protein
MLVDGYGFERFAFADKLKELCSYVFDITIEDFYDRDTKEVLTDCNLMSTPYHDIQTARCRFIHYMSSWKIDDKVSDWDALFQRFLNLPDLILVDNILTTSPRQLAQLMGTDILRSYYSDTIWLDELPLDRKIVVTDARFPNEFDHIRKNNGIIIKVENMTQELSQVMSHSSESFIKDLVADKTVFNNGVDLNKLKVNVQRLMFDIVIER